MQTDRCGVQARGPRCDLELRHPVFDAFLARRRPIRVPRSLLVDSRLGFRRGARTAASRIATSIAASASLCCHRWTGETGRFAEVGNGRVVPSELTARGWAGKRKKLSVKG